MGGKLALTSKIDAISRSSQHEEVFVQGSDQSLWHIWFNGSQWSSFDSLGGVLSSNSDISVVSTNSSSMQVFVQGKDNGVWTIGYTNQNGWDSIFTPIQGILLDSSSSLTAMVRDNVTEVIARDKNDQLWHSWRMNTASWSSWSDLGIVGGPNSNIAAISRNSNLEEVFTVNSTHSNVDAAWYIQGQTWYKGSL
jgi:hypothetical protein